MRPTLRLLRCACCAALCLLRPLRCACCTRYAAPAVLCLQCRRFMTGHAWQALDSPALLCLRQSC